MTRRGRQRLVTLCVTVGVGLALCLAAASYFLHTALDSREHEAWSFQRREAIDCTKEWARTATLPEAAQVTSVTKGGSLFTRGFRVTFTAPAGEIADWLQRSPGAGDAVVTTPSAGVRHFQITPGGGAAFAEIAVDDARQVVVIHAYWS